LQDLIDKAQTTKDGKKIITGFPGIEFDPDTLTPETLTSAANTILGNDDLYSGLTTAVSTGITDAFSDIEGLGAALAEAVSTALSKLTSEDLGEQEIGEINAQIANLHIIGVKNVGFGAGGAFGLISNILKSVTGGSDLTIPSATAKIDNLSISGADNVDVSSFSTLGERIA